MDSRTLNLEINVNKENEEEKKENCELQLWNFAGQERLRSNMDKYYKSSNCLLFIYDITKRETFENLDKWINNVRECFKKWK